MKLFILFLVLACFLQTTLIPINLCLIFLISRAFVVDEKENYFLAFFGGILLGLLFPVNLGFYAVIFLVIIKLVSVIRQSGFASNIIIILPLSLLLFTANSFLQGQFLGQTINYSLILIETGIMLPIYVLVKLWEERFIVKPHLKLRM